MTRERSRATQDPPFTPLTPDATASDDFEALEGLARTLTDSGLFRVVRRFRPRSRYHDDDGTPRRTALFVDVETTGLDLRRDRIIELAAVPFTYADDGRIYSVGEPLVGLEDPGIPIPPEVTELTTITDEMVRGQRIDDAAFEQLLEGASLVIAHNARFDRPFVERRMKAFERKPWACSVNEVPWKEHGCAYASLEYILFQSCGEFFRGHRAVDDCLVGIHVLATATKRGALPFSLLLESARQAIVRIWACESPFELKDQLKERGYRWSDGKDGRRKSWYVEVKEADAEAECGWLAEAAYRGRKPGYQRERLTALRRYARSEQG